MGPIIEFPSVLKKAFMIHPFMTYHFLSLALAAKIPSAVAIVFTPSVIQDLVAPSLSTGSHVLLSEEITTDGGMEQLKKAHSYV